MTTLHAVAAIAGYIIYLIAFGIACNLYNDIARNYRVMIERRRLARQRARRVYWPEGEVTR